MEQIVFGVLYGVASLAIGAYKFLYAAPVRAVSLVLSSLASAWVCAPEESSDGLCSEESYLIRLASITITASVVTALAALLSPSARIPDVHRQPVEESRRTEDLAAGQEARGAALSLRPLFRNVDQEMSGNQGYGEVQQVQRRPHNGEDAENDKGKPGQDDATRVEQATAATIQDQVKVDREEFLRVIKYPAALTTTWRMPAKLTETNVNEAAHVAEGTNQPGEACRRKGRLESIEVKDEVTPIVECPIAVATVSQGLSLLPDDVMHLTLVEDHDFLPETNLSSYSLNKVPTRKQVSPKVESLISQLVSRAGLDQSDRLKPTRISPKKQIDAIVQNSFGKGEEVQVDKDEPAANESWPEIPEEYLARGAAAEETIAEAAQTLQAVVDVEDVADGKTERGEAIDDVKVDLPLEPEPVASECLRSENHWSLLDVDSLEATSSSEDSEEENRSCDDCRQLRAEYKLPLDLEDESANANDLYLPPELLKMIDPRVNSDFAKQLTSLESEEGRREEEKQDQILEDTCKSVVRILKKIASAS